MQNPFFSTRTHNREIISKQQPYSLEATADLLLKFMSKSDDEQRKNTATFIKASKTMPERTMSFSFEMSLLQHNITHIRKSIYDTGIDGIRELNDHLTDKYDKNENVNAKSIHFLNWLILRLPANEELKRAGLVY